MTSKSCIPLSALMESQGNKCYYCGCQMNTVQKSPHQATLEHLIDKWSSPNHIKIESSSNLVAACFDCNNTRGNSRNRIARNYYKIQATKRNIKIAIASTSSRSLYKLFGPVPQHLFNT